MNRLVGLALVLMLVACGGEGDDGNPNGGAMVMGDPGPGEFRPDYETSADFFTRMTMPQASSIHAMMRIWYSVNARELPLAGPWLVPEGTVAIKPEYDAMGENFITVVMVKREPGYDPENQDWYYEARLPDGTLASNPTPGPAAECIGCHDDAVDTDYLLGFAIEN